VIFSGVFRAWEVLLIALRLSVTSLGIWFSEFYRGLSAWSLVTFANPENALKRAGGKCYLYRFSFTWIFS